MKRISSIDSLRGLSMVMMIFSAAIGSNSGLPTWMYHCQVPPPDFVFNPDIRGITWVDLVFPFFLFSMGAAFPFSLRKKIEDGQSNGKIALGLVKRWLTLVLFALAIGNAYSMGAYEGPVYVQGIFMVMVWAGFFLSLYRTKTKWVNPVGYALLILLFALEQFAFKVPLSIYHNDIIIMILANVALAGGLVWLLTRDNINMRCLIWMIVLAIKAITYHSGCLDFLALPGWIGWLANWSFLQYLILVLPASVLGDLLLSSQRNGVPEKSVSDTKKTIMAVTAFIAIPIQLWGLYSRNVIADLAVTAILTLTFFTLSYGKKDVGTVSGRLGFALLLAGIAFDFSDGGIAKDYCNISYLLTTGGMASLMTFVFLVLEEAGCNCKVLSLCGQNPMIAYTVCWFVITPVLYAVGLLGLLDNLSVGSPFWGLVRGVMMTSLMCVITATFSRHKIFWRT